MTAIEQMGMRLPPKAHEELDRDHVLAFRWNGITYPAFQGDTIVSALSACGERVFSRSFKHHRRRGILTADFIDPGCLVQVDDEPNVRGAHRRVAAGMDVRAQNAWPSLRVDAKAAVRLFERFLPAGFYYKTFMRPRHLWPAYEQVLRRFSPGGTVSADSPHLRYDRRYAHPDVVVAGGGPAGMAAATAAAEAGAQVMLVEEQPRLGGHLRWGDEDDLDRLSELRRGVQEAAGIEVLTDSVVTGRYDGNWVAILERNPAGAEERLIKARSAVLVVAGGLIERPYVFEGNDLPGVMLSTAVRRLMKLWAVKPGHRAVVLTANPQGDAAAADLEQAGVEVVRVLDARRGEDLVKVAGRTGVRLAECHDGSRIACDLVVTATGWTAPTSLLNMAGDRPVYEPKAARFFPDVSRLPEDVLVTGGLAGDGDPDELVAHAVAVGREAARRAGRARLAWPSAGQGTANRPAAEVDGGEVEAPVPLPPLPIHDHPELFRGRTHGIVGFSEDVSSKDLLAAAAEGYDSAELLKRYTTVTMGPPQGKLEVVNAVAILSQATGRTIGETGTTVWRPPYAPISLGALAGRIYEPVRRSAMQTWHETHHARPLVAGSWIRPDDYGDPEGEVRNTRQRVGIIDVSPLGKLDLRGPDIPHLLNRLYVNKWSKLDVGRVRYGVMCGEDGVVLDDGVTGRLGDDHYLMTTTSSGAESVAEWVEYWLQTEYRQWRVHVTPVTADYASINVAGPHSRELVSRLTDIDLSPDAFPYMHVRTGSVAGMEHCVVWRIGFTGELSYEVHAPAAYGRHIWETLLTVGADLGVRPFGVEAQRIMRLEKGHLIVGQDTDALTQGFGAGLSWAIKLDKDDFIGKPELVWQDQRDDYLRLVGLRTEGPDAVPPEACQIVEGRNTIVGRITSSRWSPTLGHPICLGLVAPHLAEPGTIVSVQLPTGDRVAATVTEHVHLDPEGVRLRG